MDVASLLPFEVLYIFFGVNPIFRTNRILKVKKPYSAASFSPDGNLEVSLDILKFTVLNLF